VQLILYLHAHGNSKSATGWLAFARVAMGFPLYLAALGAGFAIVRNARRKVAADTGPTTGAELVLDVQPATEPAAAVQLAQEIELAQDAEPQVGFHLRQGNEQ
jgi:hypothetical protein